MVKDGVVYKYNPRTKSVADNKNGLQIQADGGMFVTVRMRDNPDRVKAYYLGNIKDLPPVPKNPTKKDIEKWEALRRRGTDRCLTGCRPQEGVRSSRAGRQEQPRVRQETGYLKLFE